MSQNQQKAVDKLIPSTYNDRIVNKKLKNFGGEKLNMTEKDRPSQLTGVKRAESEKMTETFALIQDSTVRKIALAYVEGLAAAAAYTPKVTA